MKKYAIILAAGKGTRMRSASPKVLHRVLGKPMITRVLKAIDEAQISEQYVVIGHGADQVREVLGDDVRLVFQEQQLGTGHAVRIALEALKNDMDMQEEATVLVTCGDTPLIRSESLEAMLSQHIEQGNAVTVMTTVVDQPTGYGRILHDSEKIRAIVEEKDASDEEKNIKEINVGTYCFDLRFLVEQIDALDTNNAQGEFYLTDLLKIAYAKGLSTASYVLENAEDSLGVNNRVQLAYAEKLLRARINEAWMMQGVTMEDPATITIEDEVVLEPDVTLEGNVHLFGHTVIKRDAVIESGSRITNSTIGEGVVVRQSVIKDSVVGAHTTIGPFAQLRPGNIIGEQVKIGNFVEVKNSTIANESKISHHTYIGDTDMGARVNVGCGTITCNYDGKHKHRTVIGDDVFVGSNTNLIAPITIGDKVLIGAGSTLSKDVVSNALAVTRPSLVVKENWRK
ncbi:MAG: bifunctional UDP-N-acetylglucosamine diphosphorylase/glucosamine-1-phosphate N-acetyltransferase GlmU [Peptococcaceae bacterium]|nr:bifunctional UDP-N-acetylglucosamine diphosphorylase/glucosamine-1-phosphate N-acetyltransferase GlmU [Peptococcaceae bacterium]